MPHRLLLPASLAALLGCAHAPPPQPPRALDLAPSPAREESLPYTLVELRPGEAIPRPDVTACGDPRCGEAGAVARVTLPHARVAVVGLLDRYVRAMNARSLDALRPLFDDAVGTTGGAALREGAGVAREQVVSLHAQLLELMDRRGFGALGLRVVSFEECRFARCSALLRPGDWYVEWRPTSFRIAPNPTGAPPTRMIIRFCDGEARIVALNDEFFGRRAP